MLCSPSQTLSIPAATFRAFIRDTGGPGASREPPLLHEALSLCSLFSGVRSEGVLGHIASFADERSMPAGTTVAAEPEAPRLSASLCVDGLKLLRYERELAPLQREIDRLQEQGGADEAIGRLWQRKNDLLYRIELVSS